TNHPAFDTAVVFHAFDADDDAVAVHGFVQVGGADEDVAAGFDIAFWRDEPVAGWMRLQAANVEVHLLGQSEALTANLDEFAVGHEALQMAPERGPLFF